MQKKISEEIYNKIEHAKNIASLHPDESLKVSKAAYELAKVNKLSLEEAYTLIGMAFASRAKSDISSMLDYSFKALRIFKDENCNLGEAKALNLIGIAYFYSSMCEDAMKSFLKIIGLLEIIDDDLLLSMVLNNIGEIYRESQMYNQAIEYYNKAIDIVSINNWPRIHGTILSNIGIIHFVKKEFNLALASYIESYNILINSNDMVSLGEVENRIGMVYFELDELKNAEKYYFSSLEKLESIDNKYYAIETLINIAKLYMDSSLENGLCFYKKAMAVAQDIGSKKKLSEVYKLISDYYESQGDYKNALEYYKRFFNTNEEVMSSNLGDKLKIINIELKNIQETGKFDKLRIRLETELEKQRNELEQINLANQILEKKAYEDELTGIKNRRSINIYLKETVHKMHSSRDYIVLFMIDIDKFKLYNDYWGHSGGDICIKKITDCIKKIEDNNNDVFGRYGGEEFVYISTSITYDEALKLGNLIRTEVEKLGLYYMHKGEKKAVTISVGGVIGMSSEFSSIAELFELTDKELYKAKNMGRNITVLNRINQR